MTFFNVERVDKLREKYPFIADPELKFDASVSDHIKIENIDCAVPKAICAKCGGDRHSLDTRGFCARCKVEIGGFPGYSKNTRFKNDGRSGPVHRIDPKSSVLLSEVLSDDFINDVWNMLTPNARTKVLNEYWDRLTREQRVEIMKAGLKAALAERSVSHET